ncbi:MAG: hypothetical protein JWN08_1633 [Frankiales bacterium]|nr:hypothetical protein [Frankiales bacterium]
MEDARRHENELERADRNWDELLGELRVTQTGVAILFSVLLTVPFSARFDDVTGFQRGVYLTALVLSAATTVTLIAPVAYHRLLFSRGKKPALVVLGHRLARLGLALLCLTFGAVLLVLDVLLDGTTAVLLGAGFTVGTAVLWFVPPMLLRYRR